jgi:hypothetical protein
MLQLLRTFVIGFTLGFLVILVMTKLNPES